MSYGGKVISLLSGCVCCYGASIFIGRLPILYNQRGGVSFGEDTAARSNLLY